MVKPIILLARPEIDVHEALEFIKSQYPYRYYFRKVHNQNSTICFWSTWRVYHPCGLSPEEPCRTKCHISLSVYKCIEMVLKGDVKAEFLQKDNLVGRCAVANFTMVMATMTVHIFPNYAYYDQIWYMQRYLRETPDMKMRSFTTRLLKLKTYLLYFPPDRPGQLITSLPDDDIQEIPYHAIQIRGKRKW